VLLHHRTYVELDWHKSVVPPNSPLKNSQRRRSRRREEAELLEKPRILSASLPRRLLFQRAAKEKGERPPPTATVERTRHAQTAARPRTDKRRGGSLDRFCYGFRSRIFSLILLGSFLVDAIRRICFTSRKLRDSSSCSRLF